MKKLIFLIVFFIPVVALCQFRNIPWGSTKAVVMAKHPEKSISTNPDILMYKGTVQNLEAVIAYTFQKGKLSSGVYMFTETYINENNYVRDYNEIKDQLIKKYGDPHKDEMEWSNELFKDDPDKHGLAVSSGMLQMYSFWITEDKSRIVLRLSGENFKSSLGLTYLGPNYEQKDDLSGL